MISNLVATTAIGLAITAGGIVAYQANADRPEAPRPAPSTTEPQTDPVEGRAGVHVDDDGMRLHLDDPGEGSAGIELGDDGMRLWLEGEDADGGHGRAGVGMDDEGMRLWLDAER